MKLVPSIVAVIVLTLSVAYGLSTRANQSLLIGQAFAQEPGGTGALDPFADSDKSVPKNPDVENAKESKQRKEKAGRAKDTSKMASARATGNASEFIEAALTQETNHIWPDTSLQDVIDTIAARVSIPIVIDKRALEDAGVGTDKTINMNLRGFPTDRFLDLVCDELDLAWTVRDGYLLITTPEKLDTLLEVRVYNCSDLIEMIKKPAPAVFGGGSFGGPSGGQAPGGAQQKSGGGFFAVQFGGAGGPPVAEGTPGGSGEGVVATSDELIPDNESLINLIQSTVEPQSWSDAGGSGSIDVYHGGLLIVNHNGQVHRRIEQLLDMMRQAKQAQPGTVFRER